MISPIGRILVVLVLLALGGCVGRPAENAEIRTQIPSEAVNPFSADTIAGNSSTISGDNVHTVLALSAGGADGAYGAGVLAGWTKSGRRPNFDVVTGVSTGALLAVLAFLGPEYDALIRELYTNQTNETIYRKRGLGGLFGASLYNNEPFKAQIEEHITAEILAKVATEHAKGRRLYVATTNLDAGELVIWDMGRIAQGGRTNPLQHFQKVLRASASVPGFFEPVYIKPVRGVQLRQAHVDGGVKEPVLFSEFMGVSPLKKRQVFMIINGTTRRFNASNPVEANLASITQKTISELIRELQRDTIYRHYVVARDSGVEFYLTSIPDEIPIAQETLNFDKQRMRRLYRAGFNNGLGGTSNWNRKPPTHDVVASRTTVGDIQQ